VYTAIPQSWPLTGRDDELEAFRRTLADPAQRAFVIHGPAGSGKSRLAEECCAVAGGLGFRCRRAVTTAASAQVPLGALGHLLPPGADPADQVALFRRTAGFWDTGLGRAVVCADDVHFLDAASATLLGQLLDAGRIFMIATVGSGSPALGVLAGLHRGHRVELAPLDDDQTESLLGQALGGQVERGTVLRLSQASGGNPLFLSELVTGSLASGALIEAGGIWRLTRAPVRTARLAEITGREVSQAEPRDAGVLGTIALCGPTPVLGLDAGALARLERAGLIEIRTEGRRAVIVMAHPLYRDAVLDQLPLLDRRRLLTEHCRRLEASGMRRRDDQLKLASWTLAAAGLADARLLRQAARLARQARDLGTLAEVAGALSAVDGSAGPLILLAEALYELGCPDQAERAARQAVRVASGDEEYLRASRLLSRCLAWAGLAIDEASRVRAAARKRLSGRTAIEALTADRAAELILTGELRTAAGLLRDLDGCPGVALTRAWVLAEAGQTGRALRAVRCERPGSPGRYAGPLMLPLIADGRIAEAIGAGQEAYAAAIAAGSPVAQMWNAVALGTAEYWAGHLVKARSWFASCAALAGSCGYRSCEWLALTGLALTEGAMGDVAGLDEAWEQASQLAPAGHRRADYLAVPGWRLVASGQFSEGRHRLAEAARTARSAGAVLAEARLLSDVARLGDARRAARRLTELAQGGAGVLVEALASHSAALAASDPGELDRVAGLLADLGAELIAAESAARAAEFHRAAGDHAAAARSAERAQDLAAKCEGAKTPGLTVADASEPLTSREREIAGLAGQGLTSQEIASQLVISTRTVDNHLMRVYRKTGIRRRKDLPLVLRVPALSAA
jgi:DNA-binding CsgD family transcriptional regulator